MVLPRRHTECLTTHHIVYTVQQACQRQRGLIVAERVGPQLGQQLGDLQRQQTNGSLRLSTRDGYGQAAGDL